MGAPWSTYDHELIGSWVVPELEQLRRADQAGVPRLRDLLRRTAPGHGAGRVGRALPTTSEIGWYDVLTDDHDVVPGGPWFQWHYDSWQLPPDARELARNTSSSQAFVLRRNLAVQFHPELTSTMLAGWLGNGGDGKARAAGFDTDELVRETRAREAEARLRAHRLVDGFLDAVASRDVVRRAG